MTGHSKPLCSILGTLIALALVASPALAAGKKKKKVAEDAPAAEAEASAEGGGSLDSLMESSTKKPKKGKEEAAAAEEKKEEAPPEEVVEEPDAWERPPEEEKAPAKAAPPPVEEKVGDGKQISIGLLLGYGFKTDRQTGGLGTDPYGLMAGLRGGYTLDFQLYLGVYFNYFLGSSDDTGSGRIATVDRDVSANYLQYGLEVGYDFFAGPVIIRPSLEIGMATGLSDAADGVTRSVSDLMFGPGVTVMVPVAEDFFLGGDLRASLVTGDGIADVTAAVTGGVRF